MRQQNKVELTDQARCKEVERSMEEASAEIGLGQIAYEAGEPRTWFEGPDARGLAGANEDR